MKETDKKKPVSTIPEGVWEASRFDSDKRNKNSRLSSCADLQGNGYPAGNKTDYKNK